MSKALKKRAKTGGSLFFMEDLDLIRIVYLSGAVKIK